MCMNSCRNPNTAQKLKFSIKDFFSNCDQICRKLRIWSHLLKKSLANEKLQFLGSVTNRTCTSLKLKYEKLLCQRAINEIHSWKDVKLFLGKSTPLLPSTLSFTLSTIPHIYRPLRK